MYKKYIKRLFDIILACIGTLLLLPVWLIVAIAIKLTSPGPIFFRQERWGVNRSHFMILKFRTMRIEAPTFSTEQLDDSDRYITRIGKILRHTSLDETPQLLNVLSGKMSIIGPRPVICSEVELIEEREKYGANALLPGLTGWAQINGRDELSDEVKARYDGEYAKKIGFLFDLKCFFCTIPYVLSRKGVID